MIEELKSVVAAQFEAALSTLGACVRACPAEMWDDGKIDAPFCQVAFHALFYADYYLGPDEGEVFKRQAFHREHMALFQDYEELVPRVAVNLYPREGLEAYLAHCRAKVKPALAGETEESLAKKASFHWLDFSRAELYLYNIRHLQHHAAQLSLRLQIAGIDEVRWYPSGWEDA